MAQYKEEAVTGIKYRRVAKTEITDPPGGGLDLQCRFVEEECIEVGGQLVSRQQINIGTPLEATLQGPQTFNVYNLTTLQPTGATLTYNQLRQYILSLYLTLDAARGQ